MEPRRWLRRRAVPSTTADLARAQDTLQEARAQYTEQARKREQEAEGVIARMERLAEGNHLAALMWDVVTGGHR